MTRAIGSSIHRTHLTAKNPSVFVLTDIFYVMGQSNAAATISNASGFSTDADVAWGVTRSPQADRGLSGPFQNGASHTAHWGESSPFPHFAQVWYDATGRRSVWGAFAYSGTILCSITNPSATDQWSVEDMSKSLVGDYTFGSDVFTRRQLLGHVKDAVAYEPRLRAGNTYVIWCQGEADADVGASGIEEEYETQLDALFTFLKTEIGVTAFFIYELGRKGTDASEVATNEANRVAVRNAQNAVAASRADTHIIFDKAKEEGSPFNTLTVNGTGRWQAGFAYEADGQHYTTASYKAMGLSGADNALAAEGLA